MSNWDSGAKFYKRMHLSCSIG